MRGKFIHRDFLFALVTGAIDGILTALTLAGGQMLEGAHPIPFELGLRVALAASTSGAFLFFVASYARLRRELIEAERHLNLHAGGHLATTRLGVGILKEAFAGTALAATSSLVGALIPTLFGALVPGRYSAVIMASAVLGGLGFAIALTVEGGKLRWGVTLVAAGIGFAFLGALLNVVR